MSATASLELQKLLYDTLKADSAVMALANDVYDAVDKEPWGSKNGYISFGAHDAFNEDAECLVESTHTIQIDCWSRKVGSVHAKQMVDAVYAALHDNSSLTLSTNALVQIRVSLRQVLRDPDGLTTHGLLQVEAMIEELP
jgi:uncharacterized protein DUF3168